MRVFTDRKDIIDLDHVPFNYHMFSVLLILQYHTPSLRLEAHDVRTGKPLRVALMQLRLDWTEINNLNVP